MENEKRLISADAFKKAFYVDDDCDEIRFGVDGKVFVDFKAVQRAIDEAPTVDAVEVVHGRWLTTIDIDYEGDVVYHHAHMKCGFECETYGDGYNYCPNCGAKMDGGNEDATN